MMGEDTIKIPLFSPYNGGGGERRRRRGLMFNFTDGSVLHERLTLNERLRNDNYMGNSPYGRAYREEEEEEDSQEEDEQRRGGGGGRGNNFWSKKLNEIIARQQSPLITFAEILLSELPNLEMEDIIFEFPKDFLDPLQNGTINIKELIANLIKNMSSGVSNERDWYMKQFILRSTLTAVKEYYEKYVEEKKNDVSSSVSSGGGGGLQGPGERESARAGFYSAIPANSIVSTVFQSVPSRGNLVNYVDAKSSLDQWVKLINKNEKSEFEQNGIITIPLEYAREHLRYARDVLSEGLVNIVPTQKDLKVAEILTKLDTYIRWVESQARDLSSYLTHSDRGLSEGQVNLASSQLVLPFVAFNRARDCIIYLKDKLLNDSVFETNAKQNYNIVKDVLDPVINDFDVYFSKDELIFTMKKFDYEYLARITSIPSSHSSDIFGRDASLTDLGEALKFLNQLDSGSIDEIIQNKWREAEDKDTMALIFFRPKIKGALIKARNNINDMCGRDFKLVELMVSPGVAHNFATFVANRIKSAQLNVRERVNGGEGGKRVPYNSYKLAWGTTRYQSRDNKNDVRGAKQYFDDVYRVIYYDKKGGSGKVIGSELVYKPRH